MGIIFRYLEYYTNFSKEIVLKLIKLKNIKRRLKARVLFKDKTQTLKKLGKNLEIQDTRLKY